MTLADRRPLTNAYEPPLPAVRRWSICGAGLGFGPQSSQTGSQKQTIRQASADNDLRPVLEELARRTGIQPVRADTDRSYDAPAGAPRIRLPTRPPNLANSRAPIVIAIEEAAARITEQELLSAERHLTVTLSNGEADDLRSIQARLHNAGSAEAIVALGVEAWEALCSSSARIEHLLEVVAASEDKEGFPQPIAWTG